MAFFIMPKFKFSLQKLLDNRLHDLTKESVYSLGLQLIDSIKSIHNAGYTYNDLKPSSIMFDYNVSMKQILNRGGANVQVTLNSLPDMSDDWRSFIHLNKAEAKELARFLNEWVEGREPEGH